LVAFFIRGLSPIVLTAFRVRLAGGQPRHGREDAGFRQPAPDQAGDREIQIYGHQQGDRKTEERRGTLSRCAVSIRMTEGHNVPESLLLAGGITRWQDEGRPQVCEAEYQIDTIYTHRYFINSN